MTATTMTITRPETTRRTAIIARVRAALAHPGFLSGLASLAMYGGAPMAALPAKAAAGR